MNRCLRCQEPCSDKFAFCAECQAYLRGRIVQPEPGYDTAERMPTQSTQDWGPTMGTRPRLRKHIMTGLSTTPIKHLEQTPRPHISFSNLPAMSQIEQEPLQEEEVLLPSLWFTDHDGKKDDPYVASDDDSTSHKRPGLSSDTWIKRADPLLLRRLPNSVEAAFIEEEDILLAIAQGEMVPPTPASLSPVSTSRAGQIRRQHGHLGNSGSRRPGSPLSTPIRSAFIALAVIVIIALIVDGILLVLDLNAHTRAQAAITAPTLTITPGTSQPGQVIQVSLSHFTPTTQVLLTHDIQEAARTDTGSPLIRIGSGGGAVVRLLAEEGWGSGFHLIAAEDVTTHYTASATLQIIGDAPLRAPHLVLGQSLLNMGADLQGANTVQTLKLQNSGGSWISWTARSDEPWLVFSPLQGLFRSSQSIFVAVTRAHLKPGDYSGTITILSNTDVPTFVRVQMSVLPLPDPTAAVQIVAPPVFSFTATDGATDPPAQLVTVSNPGTRPLSWSLSSSNATINDNQNIPFAYETNWLSTDTTAGTIPAGSTQTIRVSVQSHRLLPSVYGALLTFRAGSNVLNSLQTVALSLTVQSRCGIATNPGSLSFTATARHASSLNQKLDLTTTPGCAGALSWQSYTSANWLSVTPGGGQMQQGTNTLITVNINAGTLLPGTYTGFITFLTDQRTLTVMVQLVVLSPSATIVPTGTQPLSLCVQQIAAVQACSSPMPGTPSAGAPLPTPTAGGPTPPPLPSPISTTPAPGPASPVMSISAPPLRFTATQDQTNPSGLPVTISNPGGSSFYWQASINTGAAPWLRVSALGGTIGANQSGQIAVNVDIADLGIGTYTAQLSFTATDSAGIQVQGSPQLLSVTLSILQPCALQAAPANLIFTSTLALPTPPPQNLVLSEVGNCGRPVSWKASTSANWVILSATSGSDNGTGSTIVIHINPKGKLPGRFTAQIILSAVSNNGSSIQNSSQQVPVMLTVLV